MRRWIPSVLFVLLVLGVTWLVAATVDPGPFQRAATGSEFAYWSAAEGVASGATGAEQLDTLPSPIYPRFLSMFWSSDPTAVRSARTTFSWLFLPPLALAVFLLAVRRLGVWGACLTAAAGIAVAPVALGAGTLQPAVLATLFGLWALVALDGERSVAGWILAGLLTGLCARFEPALGWALALILAAGALWKPGRPARPVAAGAFALLFLAGAAGSGLLVDSGERLPLIRGIDVYRGHAADAPGVHPRRTGESELRWWSGPDYFREASVHLAKGRLTPGEVQQHWLGRGIRAPFTDPLATLNRARIKLLASFQADPLAGDVSAAFLLDRGESPTLRVLLWLGRLLIPLGLAGILFARGRAGLVLVAGTLSSLAASILTFAQESTHLLAVACLVVGAGLWVRELTAGTGGRRVKVLVAGLAAVAIWGLWPALGGVPGQGISGEDYYQLGVLYDREGRGSNAIREYERALREEPSNPIPRYALAGMLARDNVNEEAVRELERIREENRGFYPGLRALAKLYQGQERWTDAAAVYGDAIALDPYNPELVNNLGTLYLQIGFYDQAILAFQKALELEPGYESALANLETIRQMGLGFGGGSADSLVSPEQAQEVVIGHLRAGQIELAQETLNRAFGQFGADDGGLNYAQGTLFLVTERPEEAIPYFEKARPVLGRSVLFLNNIAAALAATGRYCDAVREWTQALELQPANERVRRSLADVGATIDSLGVVCP